MAVLASFVLIAVSQLNIRAYETPFSFTAITVGTPYPYRDGLSLSTTDFQWQAQDRFLIVGKRLRGPAMAGRSMHSTPLVSALWVEDGKVVAYRAIESEKSVLVSEESMPVKEFLEKVTTWVGDGAPKADLPLLPSVANGFGNLLPIRLQWGANDWLTKVKQNPDAGRKGFYVDTFGGIGHAHLSFNWEGGRILNQTESVDYGARAPSGYTRKTDFHWGSLGKTATGPVFKRPSEEELRGMGLGAGR